MLWIQGAWKVSLRRWRVTDGLWPGDQACWDLAVQAMETANAQFLETDVLARPGNWEKSPGAAESWTSGGMMGDKRGGQQKQSPDKWVLHTLEKGLHVILRVKRRSQWRILSHRGDSSHIRYKGSGVQGPSKYHYANITYIWAQLYWLNWLRPFI